MSPARDKHVFGIMEKLSLLLLHCSIVYACLERVQTASIRKTLSVANVSMVLRRL